MDAIWIAEKLEVHGVFQLVPSEPMKTVALESADPAAGQRRLLEHRFDPFFTQRMGRPRVDAAAARVLLGIDVDRDAEQVIAHLAAAIGIALAKATHRVRRVTRALLVAARTDAPFDATQRRHDLLMELQRQAHEARARRE